MASIQHARKIQLDRLLYSHYQHENLTASHKFFTDFGLIPVQEDGDLVYYRGFGENPYVYVAEKSPDESKHFVGVGWVVISRDDLEIASKLPAASIVQESTAPGGGQFVDVKDPNGINIRLIHGITLRDKENLEKERPKPVIFNTWEEKPRKGHFQRFGSDPSKIHKLGHYGLVVDKSKFEDTVNWYLQTLSLATTDCFYDGDSGKDMMNFMHIDKGQEFTDHHSLFIQSPQVPVKACYPHHSSFEVDDLDTQLLGHDHLEKEGWTNCWGVSRHLLGSQIFDYWFDSSGNIVEHYSDGDLVNSKTIVTREKAAPDTMAVWGPNVTLAFLTGNIEDITKELVVPQVKNVSSFLTYQPKVEVEEQLERCWAQSGVSYTLVFNNVLLDWALSQGLLMDPRDRIIKFYDGGKVLFSTTTMATVGRAVAGVLEMYDETKNRAIYVHDIVITQQELVDMAQELTEGDGGKEWTVVNEDTTNLEAVASLEAQKGVYSPRLFYAFAARGAFGRECGGHFKRTDNKLLGIDEMDKYQLRDLVHKIIAQYA